MMSVRVRRELVEAYRSDRSMGGGTHPIGHGKAVRRQIEMTMMYVCEAAEKPPYRKISGLRVLSAGVYSSISEIAVPDEYAASPFKWGGTTQEAEPLAAVLLTDCLRLAKAGSDELDSARYSNEDSVSTLCQEFAERFVCSANPDATYSLDWLEVLAWLDDKIHGELGTLADFFRRIRDFESMLLAAFDDGGHLRKHRVGRDIWEMWNIAAFAELCLSNGHLKGKRLRRFVDHFLDLKFKLYMLAEVDVPTYASAKEMWGLDRSRPIDTPHGVATQLSEGVTLIVKSRAIWESIMNLVYWYVTGKDLTGVPAVDEDGVSYKSKQKKFFPWLTKQPLWISLETFEPLVDRLDQLRTSEIHRFSRVRSNFTQMTLEPIEQCVELVNTVLMYVLAQFVAAIALQCSVTYDAGSTTSITLG